ncbi:MAG TPA: hypothetical protein DEQ02_05645 [Ruminococcaceae bacterium]|nr:hypothetical protein [Oscillospiraceae bacterium]
MSDECFKMALTDAISVSCKALGFGADVYWDKDRTKYSGTPEGAGKPPGRPQNVVITEAQIKELYAAGEAGGRGRSDVDKIIADNRGYPVDKMPPEDYDGILTAIKAMPRKGAA